MATFLREVAADRVRPCTLHSYEQFARLYLNAWLGKHRLDKLRAQHINACFRKMSKNLASSSGRQTGAILRRALTVAVRGASSTPTAHSLGRSLLLAQEVAHAPGRVQRRE